MSVQALDGLIHRGTLCQVLGELIYRGKFVSVQALGGLIHRGTLCQVLGELIYRGKFVSVQALGGLIHRGTLCQVLASIWRRGWGHMRRLFVSTFIASCSFKFLSPFLPNSLVVCRESSSPLTCFLSCEIVPVQKNHTRHNSRYVVLL